VQRWATAAVIACSLIGAANASSQRNNFRIAGVNIGMTASQALAALREHGITATTRKGLCVSDIVRAAKQGARAQEQDHCVSELRARPDDELIIITFEEDFPANPGTSVVGGLALNALGTSSAFPTGSKLAEETLMRIGAPTLTDGSLIALWCAQRCDSIAAATQSTRAGPLLYLRRGQGGGISVQDEQYSFPRVDAARRYLKARGIKSY
jgi:hypothetical protein